MEKILKCIGLSFLSVANTIHQAKNTFDSYLFDLIFEDDHLKQ